MDNPHRTVATLSGIWVLGLMLLMPGLAQAGFANNQPSAPMLRGPASISTSQPFNIQFYYPKGQIKGYLIEFFHCATTSKTRPSNDSNTEPFPTSDCEPAKTVKPNGISPDSGEVTINVKYGVTQLHEHGAMGNPAVATQQWLQGNWFVRVRLTSSSGVSGPWSNWHHTLVGNGRVGRFVGAKGLRADRSTASTRVVMHGLKPPVVQAPGQKQVERGNRIDMVFILPRHHDYTKWVCCDFEVQRAKIVTKENMDYINKHHGFPVANGPRKPWNEHVGSRSYEAGQILPGSKWHISEGANIFRPHSREFGYRYWMRVREEYYPKGLSSSSNSAPGPWSQWRTFVVQEPLQTNLSVGVPKNKVRQIQPRPTVSGQQGSQTRQQRALPAIQQHRLMLPAQQ